MIRVGLTGTIGAGKSAVASLFEEWGARRIDADELARQVVEPGTPALERIRHAFGAEMITPEGRLARDTLRRLVFSDPEARARLEEIVHPEVNRLRAALVEEAASSGVGVVVQEVPLLLEKGIADEFDVVIAVDAPLEIRSRRACAERGLAPDEFLAIDSAQWPGERKRAAAHHVVWNDGDLGSLRRRARSVWERIMATGRAGPARWRVDLHMHTSASRDCLSDPEQVVRRARALGLDRIAVTDHDEIDGALVARECDPELVIVGEEVRTAEGLDLIGLFLERRIPPGGRFRDVAEEIRGQGGVVYLPHPFDAHRGATEDFLDGVGECVDAVEGFNARVHDARRNMKAREWANLRGLPVGAGSDAHLLREIGRGTVRMPPFDGPREFLAGLHHGVLDGVVSSYLVHLGSTWAKLWKRLRPLRR